MIKVSPHKNYITNSKSLNEIPLFPYRNRLALISIFCWGIFISPVYAQVSVTLPEIDMEMLAHIESSNRCNAFNKGSGARGKFQITPIVLKSWNIFHPTNQYKLDNLFDCKVNTKIAVWYVKRIETMLLHYQLPTTIDNFIIAWNFGIGNLVKGKDLPQETINFIAKYKGGIR